jgi:hypothetical protein
MNHGIKKGERRKKKGKRKKDKGKRRKMQLTGRIKLPFSNY